ncbi:MAG: NAD(P)/FAD-dependent oxidoreductase [Proteobacteria bacterium]|nr:NAD(P)/FAD-dependent oxidoreductase [Pseudomonadota bacterium]
MILPNQVSADKVEKNGWDVLVAGAGPAGSAASICLARLGYRVLMLDEASFPREKVCGDGFLSDAQRSLKRLGAYEAVESEGRVSPRLSMISPSGHKTHLNGAFLTCKRVTADAILAARAVEEGAVFARGRVESLEAGADGVEFVLSNGSGPVRGRVGMIATGARLSLLNGRGIANARRRCDAVGIRCYVQSDHDLDELLVCEDQSVMPGYGWIFPMANGEFNMGVGLFNAKRNGDSNLNRMFDRFITQYEPARLIMEKSRGRTPCRAAMLRCGLSGAEPVAGENLLVLGEALGATYPYTGEGIGTALESGELAARAVHEAFCGKGRQGLALYPRLVRQILVPRHRGWCLCQKYLSSPRMNDLFIRLAKPGSFAQSALEHVCNHSMNPAELLSPLALARAWVRWKKGK